MPYSMLYGIIYPYVHYTGTVYKKYLLLKICPPGSYPAPLRVVPGPATAHAYQAPSHPRTVVSDICLAFQAGCGCASDDLDLADERKFRSSFGNLPSFRSFINSKAYHWAHVDLETQPVIDSTQLRIVELKNRN